MDENEVERIADELFEQFEDMNSNLSLDDSLSIAEAMELRFSNYAETCRYDLRRRR